MINRVNNKNCFGSPWCEDDRCCCDKYYMQINLALEKEVAKKNKQKKLALAYTRMLQYLGMKTTTKFWLLVIISVALILLAINTVSAVEDTVSKGVHVGTVGSSKIQMVDGLKGGVVCYVLQNTSGSAVTMSCLKYRN